MNPAPIQDSSILYRVKGLLDSNEDRGELKITNDIIHSLSDDILVARNCRIAVLMDVVSLQYDMDGIDSMDMLRIDNEMDELAMESDVIEATLENRGIVGGARLWGDPSVAECYSIARSMFKDNAPAGSLATVASTELASKNDIANEPPLHQSWEEKLDEATINKIGAEKLMWSGPILSSLNKHYLEEYGEYSEKGNLKDDLTHSPKKRKTVSSPKVATVFYDSLGCFSSVIELQQSEIEFPDTECLVSFELEEEIVVIVIQLPNREEVGIQVTNETTAKCISALLRLDSVQILDYDSVGIVDAGTVNLTVRTHVSISCNILNGKSIPNRQHVDDLMQVLNVCCAFDAPKDLDISLLDLDSLWEAIRPSSEALHPIPSGLISILSRYQQRALSWLVSRENCTEPRFIEDPLYRMYRLPDGRSLWFNWSLGLVRDTAPPNSHDSSSSVLADEMGLGKSVEVIALMLVSKRTTWSNSTVVGSARYRDRIASGDFRRTVKVSCSEAGLSNILECEVVRAEDSVLESCATLIVSPANILLQWKNEIEKHAPSMTVLLYESGNTYSNDYVASHDVVLTTYEVLRKEVNYSQTLKYGLRASKKKYKLPISSLLAISWWRLVLDEAQYVENAVATSARMARRIQSRHRLCVTGTPIGKRGLEDLFGLMVFLDVYPFNIARCWKRGIEQAPNGKRVLVDLLKRVMWRHCKRHVTEELQLPQLVIKTVEQTMAPVEHEYYHRVKDELIGQRERGVQWSQIDVLRQVACHPQLARHAEELLGSEILPMNQIRDRLVSRSQDDVSMAERDLCKALTRLGASYYNSDDFDNAEFVLEDAWAIADGGFTHASSLRKSSNTHLLTPTEAVATKNSQVRAWRAIENTTAWHLSRVMIKKLEGDNLTEDDRRIVTSNRDLLTKQYTDARHELVTNEMYRVEQLRNLLVQYKEHVLPQYTNLVCPEVLDLMNTRTDFLSNPPPVDSEPIAKDPVTDTITNPERLFYANNKDKMEILERRIQVQRHLAAKHQSFYTFIGRISAMREILNGLPGPIGLLKLEVVQQLKRVKIDFSVVIGNACRYIQEGYIPIIREVQKLEQDVSLRLPSSELVLEAMEGNSPDHLYYSSRLSECINDWVRFTDSIKVLRIFKELEKQQIRLDVEEHNLVLQTEALDHDCRLIPEEDVDVLKKLATTAQVNVLTKIRALNYLRKKFGLLDSKSNALADRLCSICHSIAHRAVLTQCGHLYCVECASKWVQPKKLCAVCRASLPEASDIFQLAVGIASNSGIVGAGEYGTKIEAIVREILTLHQSGDLGKCLVFSQFPMLLDLVAKALTRNGVSYCSLQGPAQVRARIIEKFQVDPTLRVMLMSLRRDASGITLVSAQHVFILEPSLNPAIEEQAINRVHRRGQKSDILVRKYVMLGTVEERIVELQAQVKQLQFSGSSVSMETAATLEDEQLQSLLQ